VHGFAGVSRLRCCLSRFVPSVPSCFSFPVWAADRLGDGRWCWRGWAVTARRWHHRCQPEDFPDPPFLFLRGDLTLPEQVADGRLLHPFLEVGHDLLLRLLPLLRRALLIELQPRGAVVTAAQFHHVLA
jgi:hypothetical protein